MYKRQEMPLSSLYLDSAFAERLSRLGIKSRSGIRQFLHSSDSTVTEEMCIRDSVCIAYCSAGSPYASYPMGFSTLKPYSRL